jgi:hypothetical protein
MSMRVSYKKKIWGKNHFFSIFTPKLESDPKEISTKMTRIPNTGFRYLLYYR